MKCILISGIGKGWPGIIAFEPKTSSEYSTITPLFYFTKKKTNPREAVWSFSKFSLGPQHSKSSTSDLFHPMSSLLCWASSPSIRETLSPMSSFPLLLLFLGLMVFMKVGGTSSQVRHLIVWDECEEKGLSQSVFSLAHRHKAQICGNDRSLLSEDDQSPAMRPSLGLGPGWDALQITYAQTKCQPAGGEGALEKNSILVGMCHWKIIGDLNCSTF